MAQRVAMMDGRWRWIPIKLNSEVKDFGEKFTIVRRVAEMESEVARERDTSRNILSLISNPRVKWSVVVVWRIYRGLESFGVEVEVN